MLPYINLILYYSHLFIHNLISYAFIFKILWSAQEDNGCVISHKCCFFTSVCHFLFKFCSFSHHRLWLFLNCDLLQWGCIIWYFVFFFVVACFNFYNNKIIYVNRLKLLLFWNWCVSDEFTVVSFNRIILRKGNDFAIFQWKNIFRCNYINGESVNLFHFQYTYVLSVCVCVF